MSLYLDTSTLVDDDQAVLVTWEFDEAISEDFRIFVQLSSTNTDVDISAIVGQAKTLTLVLEDQSQRYLNGIVTQCRSAVVGNRAHYYVELRPWTHVLRSSTDSRIYQNLAVGDIVSQLFRELGYADFQLKLSGSYTPREYCVQYQETAWQFFRRLCEEEGIYYYFTHEQSRHVLVLADSVSAYLQAAAPSTLEYVTQGAAVANEAHISTVELATQVVTKNYAVDDYNFTTPSTDLLSSSAATATTGVLERFEYPGRITDKSAGERVARLRAEEQATPAKQLRGKCFARSMASGATFTLSQHPLAALNGDYLAVSVAHRGGNDDYENQFVAIPATVSFRPSRTTTRPRIAGSQTAKVVGKSGEEIWTDQYGRIKVQFHWDRYAKGDETSSCFIRVSQTWAGAGWGAWFLPRIGQEVVVTFLEGDPDRPLVTGCVYNSETTLPYALPGEQNKSTILSRSTKQGTAGNELRFDDTKGSEEFYVHAQKDQNIVVENSRTVTIVAGDETFTVKQGNRGLEVTQGNETYTIGGTRTYKVGKDETRTNEANLSETIKGNHDISIDGNLSITVKGTVKLSATGGITVETKDALTATATTSMSASANTEMSLTCKGSAALEGSETTVKGSASLSCQTGGMGSLEAGGVLTISGALVSVN